MTRQKRARYIVFQIITNSQSVEESLIKSSIWKTYQNIYGLYNSSNAGLYFEEYNEFKKTGIILCSHTSLNHLLTVLAIITEINGVEVLIHVLQVTGTIDKAKKFLSINNFNTININQTYRNSDVK